MHAGKPVNPENVIRDISVVHSQKFWPYGQGAPPWRFITVMQA